MVGALAAVLGLVGEGKAADEWKMAG